MRLVFVFEVYFAWFHFGDFFVGLELIGVAGELFVPFLFEVIIEIVIEIVCVEIVEWIS